MTFRRALVAVVEVDKTFFLRPPPPALSRDGCCVTCYEHPSLSMLDYSNVGEQIRSGELGADIFQQSGAIKRAVDLIIDRKSFAEV